MNNDLNKVSMRKCEYSSSRIALDTDGQEWIEFIFYLYYSDEYCSRQIRAFSINSVTPNKWKFRDTLIRLSQLFSRNKCLYEIITVGTWEDRNIETSKVLDIDTYTFFE